MGVSVADVLSEHGSPLWLANLDVVRDRWRSFTAAWENVWPEVEVAYCYQANRMPAILRTLAAAGAGHMVACEAEYVLARTVVRAPGKRIVVQGPYKSVGLLESAARDGALVVADSEDDLRRATAAGVRRLGLRVETAAVGHGPSQYGVPEAKVTAAHRDAVARGLRLEALAFHLPVTGFERPLSQVGQFTEAVVTRWPQPPERYAAATRLVASLAVRLGVPVVDVGGGMPPAPDEQLYARTVAGALGAVGFEGRLLAEPGRAIVGEAVELGMHRAGGQAPVGRDAMRRRRRRYGSAARRPVALAARRRAIRHRPIRRSGPDRGRAVRASRDPAPTRRAAGGCRGRGPADPPRGCLQPVAIDTVRRPAPGSHRARPRRMAPLRTPRDDRGPDRHRPRRATRARDHSTNGLRLDACRLCTPTATAHGCSTRSDGSPSP